MPSLLARPRAPPPAAAAVRRPPARRAVRAAAASDVADAPVKYDHLLVALVDASYTSLSDGSRTALATTGFLARQNGAARVSVLFCDAETPPVEGQNARERAVGAALESAGVTSGVSFIERALDEQDNAAAAVGDAADSVAADLLVLSSDAVHAKAVDANLLAEFVDCPVLLLP